MPLIVNTASWASFSADVVNPNKLFKDKPVSIVNLFAYPVSFEVIINLKPPSLPEMEPVLIIEAVTPMLALFIAYCRSCNVGSFLASCVRVNPIFSSPAAALIVKAPFVPSTPDMISNLWPIITLSLSSS
jgi:hypothetical protein